MDGLTSANLKSRSYFPTLLAGRESVGTVVSSHSTGRDVAIVAVPVMVNGTVTGVLGASVYLDSITTYVQDSLGLPDTVQFFAIDPAGNIALHSNDEQIFQNNMSAGTAQPGSVGAAVNAMLAEKAGTISYDSGGRHWQGVFSTLFPDRLAYCRRVCGYSVDRVEMTRYPVPPFFGTDGGIPYPARSTGHHDNSADDVDRPHRTA